MPGDAHCCVWYHDSPADLFTARSIFSMSTVSFGFQLSGVNVRWKRVMCLSSALTSVMKAQLSHQTARKQLRMCFLSASVYPYVE